MLSVFYNRLMKRGPKPKGQVSLVWSPQFAYAVGLLTADGCLSKDGRHIDLTSKDKVQVQLFKKCLGLETKLGLKYSGAGNLAYHTQFGDVLFYNFLLSIGLSPAKSKTIQSVAIPKEYFIDFLRGYFDGDGSSYSYYDPVFKKSFRFYVSFISASPPFIHWLRKEIESLVGIRGFVAGWRDKSYVQLKYSKKEAVLLCRRMYYSTDIPCLRRKRFKVQKALRIIESRRGGEIGRHATFRS